MRLLIFDLSRGEDNPATPKTVDFVMATLAGVVGGIFRVTNGSALDPTFAIFRPHAEASGMPWGAFGVLYPPSAGFGSPSQQAKAFVDFLFSPAAQRVFADAGYRPVAAGVHGAIDFKTPAGLFAIADLGGWTAVNKRFFDPAGGLLVDVERRLGVATSK